MNLKKILFRIVAIIYDIVTLFWCYVLGSNLIYYLTPIGVNEGSIGIIGGAYFPTAIFEYTMILRVILQIVFIISSLFSVVLLTVTAFKSRVKKRANIWLICLLSGALTLFILFPKLTLIITPINRLAFTIGVMNTVARTLYCVASLGAIGFNIFSLIKRKDETK